MKKKIMFNDKYNLRSVTFAYHDVMGWWHEELRLPLRHVTHWALKPGLPDDAFTKPSNTEQP